MKAITFYYVANQQTGESYLVNAQDEDRAIKMIAEDCSCNSDVLISNTVIIPERDYISLESIAI